MYTMPIERCRGVCVDTGGKNPVAIKSCIRSMPEKEKHLLVMIIVIELKRIREVEARKLRR